MLTEAYAHAREDFERAPRGGPEGRDRHDAARDARRTWPQARAELDRETRARPRGSAARGAHGGRRRRARRQLQKARDELERATLPLAALLMDGVAKAALSGKTLDEV